jgi:shikimate kinase
MIDPITEYIIQEGYLFSDKDISVNLEKFINGDKKKLLIVGTMGSGKTTVAEKLAKRYKSKWIRIDSLWWRLKQKYFKNDNIATKNVKEALEKKVKEHVIKLLKNNERMIIEGIELIYIYNESRNLIVNQAMIILGLSSLRAGIRAGKRNMKREGGEGWRELYWMAKKNMKEVEPKLKVMRKDVMNLPDVEIGGYEV